MSLSQEERLARRKEKRMAGDALNEDTQESVDASEALSRSERNKQTRERIGNDPEQLAERIGDVDRDKYDLSGFSDKQINMALQGKTFDQNDYARLTGKSVEPDKGEDDVGIPTPTPETTPSPGGGSGGGIDMGDTDQTINPGNPGEVGGGGFPGTGSGLDNSTNVNVNQDNDIVNSISGSNNTVNNAQDNSVNTMGGNAKSFNGTRGSMFKDSWMQNFFS